MKKIKILSIGIFLLASAAWPLFCRALAPGALLYRTSGEGKMYGYSGDPIIESEKGIVKHINSGHVGLYIGQEDGVDYVVEALGDGIVKTPAAYFVNEASGEKFLGAKIPRAATPLQLAKVIALAKSLVARELKYDFDFKKQKGPDSGQWTCVGLTEKLYESADISNPNNLGALEYDSEYYAVDITPDGFDNFSVFNERGDCFSKTKEFSRIAPYKNLLLPAPELLGYDAGLERGGERFIFFPYTQFLQDSLLTLNPDIVLSSSFSDSTIRGKISTLGLVLRWSLINNPLSSLKNIAARTKALALDLKKRFFGTQSTAEITLNEKIKTATKETGKSVKKTTKKTRAKKTAAKKATSSKSPAGALAPLIKVNKASSKKTLSDQLASTSSLKSDLLEKNKQLSQEKAEKALPNPKKNSVKKSVALSVAATSTAVSAAATLSYEISQAASSSSGGASSNGAAERGLIRFDSVYSTGENDWVKLYNPGESDIDLAAAAYRLEKTKTAEDPSLILRFGDPDDGAYPGGTIIKARDYYLVVNDEANAYYKSQADAIVTREGFSWSSSGYTLYLGSGAISSSNDPDIREALGFGPEATYFQGQGPAPEIKDNYILSRIATTTDNFQDFILIKSSDPTIVWEAASSTENIATTTVEIATGTSQIATSTLETATTTEVIATTTESAATTTLLSAALVLIKKIYSTGNNDWIELFNPTDNDIDLAAAAYRLEKTKTAEDPSLMLRCGNLEDGTYPGGTIIKSQDSYLIVRDDANDYYKNQADAIATREEFSWTGSDYTIYSGNGPLSSMADENIIEAVGFGAEASYYQGSRPAPAILDNYILNRVATSGDNYLDFTLLASDDPSILWPGSTTTSTSLFIAPNPINSPNLRNLWHFNECYGSGQWAVGKWDCAREIGFIYEPLSGVITPLDGGKMTLSFYYKKSRWSPNLDFRLSNGQGEIQINLQLGLLQLGGLPNSIGNYYDNVFPDDDWHQFVLVLDQEAGYWATYQDGQEQHYQSFLQSLPGGFIVFSVGGNQGSVLIDEIAFWDRPLSALEVADNYEAQAPFNPLASREPQTTAVRSYLWEFLETEKEVSYGEKLSAPLPLAFNSKDLSLDFWWRNSSYPRGGRTKISLKHGTEEKMSLTADYYRQEFYFNGNYGILREGINEAVSYDDKWHHFALTYDSYRYLLRFYVDGLEQKSFSYFWIKDGEEPDILEISGESDKAEISSLSVWDGALSQAQINDIYNNIR